MPDEDIPPDNATAELESRVEELRRALAGLFDWPIGWTVLPDEEIIRHANLWHRKLARENRQMRESLAVIARVAGMDTRPGASSSDASPLIGALHVR